MELGEKVEVQTVPPSNHRTCPRFAVDAEAQLFLVKHGLTVNCRVLDLSLAGCRMRTGRALPSGTQVPVEVTFSVNKISVRLAGVIRRSNEEDEVGIEFAAISARRRAEWAEVVEEVQATLAAKAADEAAKATEEAEKPKGGINFIEEEVADGARPAE